MSSNKSLSLTGYENVLSLIDLAKGSPDLKALSLTSVTELPEEKIIQIDAETSVDSACEILIANEAPCLTVTTSEDEKVSMVGLFDCADVNAFLTLASQSHLINEDDIDVQNRIIQILNAARNGKVPVKLCADLSEKNPFITAPKSDSVATLLRLFSQGAHRVVIDEYPAMISNMGLLGWLVEQAHNIEVLKRVLEEPVSALELGSKQVTSCLSTETVLDAMKIMSEQGLSSIAILDDKSGDLMSTITVTDIARIVAPSQSKKILTTSLGQFIRLIKAPDGSLDGVDKYPVYGVLPDSTLSHVIQKLLATNAQRVFIITDDVRETTSVPLKGNLRGVVSAIDILSFFARLVGISDVDPTRMQRNRRASSASSSHKSM